MNGLPSPFVGYRTVLITRGPKTEGVVLEILAAHPDDVKSFRSAPKLDAQAEAAQLYEALLALPAETRSALYTLLHENADGFVGVKPRGGRVYEPVKGHR